MTEKDLWGYQEAKKVYRRALETLREYEGLIYAAAGQLITGMPIERAFETDKLAEVAHRHDLLIRALHEALAAVATAGQKLDGAAECLSEEEREFLHNRYRLGLSWTECEKKMHYGHSQVARIRVQILAKIQKMGQNGIEKTTRNV